MRAWLRPRLPYSGHQGAKEQGSRTPQVTGWCCYFRKQHLPRRLLSQMTHSSVYALPFQAMPISGLSLPTLCQLTHPSLEVTVLNQLISSSSCGTQNYTDVRYTEILCKPSAMYQVFYNSRRQVDGKPETQVSATGWARHSAPSLSHQDARCGGNERRARKPPKSGNAGELRLSYTPGVTLWSTVSLPNLLQPPRETQEPHQTKPQSWGKPSREAGWLVSPVSREDPLSEKREKAEHLNS